MRGCQALGCQIMDLSQTVHLRVGENDAPQEVGDVLHVVDSAEAEAADRVRVNVQALIPQRGLGFHASVVFHPRLDPARI